MKLLAAALIEAQKEFLPAVKNKVNPHFKSQYVDLAEVIEVTRTPLANHGLVVVQPTRLDANGRPEVVTLLIHTSGESIEGAYPLIPAKQDPQGYGSAMTYARRYCLMAMLGIAPEDDDGEHASGKPEANGHKAAPPATKQANGFITREQAGQLIEEMGRHKDVTQDKLFKQYQITRYGELKSNLFQDALDYCKAGGVIPGAAKK